MYANTFGTKRSELLCMLNIRLVFLFMLASGAGAGRGLEEDIPRLSFKGLERTRLLIGAGRQVWVIFMHVYNIHTYYFLIKSTHYFVPCEVMRNVHKISFHVAREA
jgi:hypothetical protein